MLKGGMKRKWMSGWKTLILMHQVHMQVLCSAARLYSAVLGCARPCEIPRPSLLAQCICIQHTYNMYIYRHICSTTQGTIFCPFAPSHQSRSQDVPSGDWDDTTEDTRFKNLRTSAAPLGGQAAVCGRRIDSMFSKIEVRQPKKKQLQWMNVGHFGTSMVDFLWSKIYKSSCHIFHGIKRVRRTIGATVKVNPCGVDRFWTKTWLAPVKHSYSIYIYIT